MRFPLLFSLLTIFAGAGCATAPPPERVGLVDVMAPFGLPWSVSDAERDAFADLIDISDCPAESDDFPPLNDPAETDSCPQRLFSGGTYEKPEPLENGYMDVVFAPNGQAIERSHIFGGFSAMFPPESEEEAQRERDIVEFEVARWQTALEHRYGPAMAYGEIAFFIEVFFRSETGEGPCQAWYVEPVAIFLCRDRLFVPDASIASLAFTRLDLVSNGDRTRQEIVGP